MFNLANSKVCVAGSSGFLGSAVVAALEERGAIVRGVSLNGPAGSAPFQTIQADLRNYQEASSVLAGQDALVVSAAVTSGAQVMAANPLVHLFDNTLINGSLLRAAVEVGVRRVVFISSSTVYPVGSSPMREPDTNGTYFSKYEVVATMKKFAEDSFLCASRMSGTDAVIVRPGNAYGPRDHFGDKGSHVIPALIAKIAEATSTLEVWGDGEDIKNFIYVKDLAVGIVQALECGRPGEIYNLGGQEEIQIKDVIEILLNCADKRNLAIHFDTSKPSMIPVRRIDSSKAAAELGFRPSTQPDIGLCETYNWYVNQKT